MHTAPPKPQTSGTPAEKVLYSRSEIEARGGPKKSHLYDLIDRGQFPAPVVKLGTRYTRWSVTAVESWLSDPAAWIAAQPQATGVAA